MLEACESASCEARHRFLAILLGFSALTPMPALAQVSELDPITIGEPEGFAALSARQTVLVDLYFGGRHIGEAQIRIEAGKVELVDPSTVAKLIPGLVDPLSVETALSDPAGLPGNAHLVCSIGSNTATCGRLSPSVAGVIFDRNTFRLHLFVNEELLSLNDQSERSYLPAPTSRYGLINRASAVLSGSFDEGDNYLQIADRLLLSHGSSRLIAEVGYSDDLGLQSDQFVLQFDRPEHRLLAGAFWAPGTDFVGRQKILGVGVESQIDTRLDKEELRANPIILFLTQRSRVDILRDGRILSSAVYEAGNQRLDTGGLPEGSYQVVLRISEAGGHVREETVFFQKSRRLPSLGRHDFFAFVGLQVDDPYSLKASDETFLQGGWSGRLNRRFALDATATLSDGEVIAEAGGTVIVPLGSARAALLGSSSGTVGGLIQIQSGGFSRLNFNIEFRHLEIGRDISALAYLGTPRSRAGSGALQLPVVRPNTSLSQGNAAISFSLPRVQFFGTAFYRDGTGENPVYGIGPSVRWEVLQRNEFRVAVNANAAITDRGETGFVGISISIFGRRGALTTNTGPRFSTIADESAGFVGAIAGGWHESDLRGAQLSLGAGYEHDPDQDVFNLSTQVRGKPASFSGAVIHSSREGGTQTQYSASAETIFALGSGSFDLQSRATSDSMIMARVRGARPDDRFELIINDAPAGVIMGTSALTVSLPSYQAYRVRVRSVGAGLVSYDGSEREIGLYPGTVETLQWQARPIRVILARLIFDDGSPVAEAFVSAGNNLAETDQNGQFQIEALDDRYLTVGLKDGATFRVELPSSTAAGEWGFLGNIHCCSRPLVERFAAVELEAGK